MTFGATKAKRIAIAMSGGVDSSVAAALLIERGYDVIGITMQFHPLRDYEDEHLVCADAAEKASETASMLGIPHHIVDLSEEFRRSVIESFVQEYSLGKTPNPCVRCNRFVKFGALLERARQLGASMLATGHYARVLYDEGQGRWLLKRGVDRGKDQSYALFALTQEQLARVVMPLGEMTKNEVRRVAGSLGLPAAHHSESQDICFVANRDYKSFLARIRPEATSPGPLLDLEGNEIGHHKGVIGYTVGQRRGLGIAAGEPLYVISIDAKRNAVIVGREADLYARELVAKDVNLISVAQVEEPFAVTAKVRYNMRDVPAVLYPYADGRLRLLFDEPQRAITPGQAVVFYDGEDVVGGGTIEGLAGPP